MKSNKPIFFAYLAALCLAAFCPFDSKGQFRPLSSMQTGFDFENKLVESDSLNIFIQKFPYISFSGGGIAVADFNKDGWEDVLMVANQEGAKLYKNLGGMQFEVLPPKKGIRTKSWSNGATIADVNNDGLLDVFITKLCYPDSSSGGNMLFINKGDFVFQESSKAFGLNYIGNSIQATFFDYDQDGYMDLYLVNQPLESFSDHIYDVFNQQAGQTYPFSDLLYHNEKGKGFKDVSQQAGIKPENAFGLSVITADFNQDNWTDIYVGNDYVHRDFLYINKKDGTFEESLSGFFDHTSLFTMGSAFCDLNGDALSDLITLDMSPRQTSEYKISTFEVPIDKYNILTKNHFRQEVRNMVQLNNGQGKFSEIGQLVGLANSDWSWSVLSEDFNADGKMDVFISNGLVHNVLDRDFMKYKVDSIFRAGQSSSYKASPIENYRLIKLGPRKTPNQLHLQTENLSFPLNEDFGINQKLITTAAVAADLDKDGDLDLVLSNSDTLSVIMENTLQKKNFLSIYFENPNTAFNSYISVYQSGKKSYQEITNNQGILSAHFPGAFFGFPSNSPIDSVVIVSGVSKKALIKNPPLNKELWVKQSDFKKVSLPAKPAIPNRYEVSKLGGMNYEDKPSLFNDLKKEPLLPHRLNVYGPYAAVGDLDGNGLEDVVISGSGPISTRIYFQQSDGRFFENSTDMKGDSIYVDGGIVLADFDRDEDLDLFVVSGGNEHSQSQIYQDRLYINNGQGRFVKCEDCLPIESNSGSEAQVLDFDKDGDLDLFVGSRNVPGRFPEIPESQLLENKKGKFTNSTPPILSKTGMVNTVLCKDFDQDGWTDILLAGEWMPVLMFWNNKGTYEKADTLLPEGFWQHLNWIEGSRGGTFLIAGNWGLNTRFVPNAEGEIRLYTSDIDENGSLDPLLCSMQEGVYKPVIPYEKFTKELPMFRRKFLRYKQYKEASISDCLGSKREKVDLKFYKESHSRILTYIGNRKFKLCVTPPELQFGPIFSSVKLEDSQEGYPLVYLHGNFFDNAPEIGPIDANKGLVLELQSEGKLRKIEGVIPNVSGNVRKLVPVQMPKESKILILKSGGEAEIIGPTK